MIIVYKSNTGFTREYAQMLAKAEKLRCIPLEEAEGQLDRDAQVFYMGPLMAGHIEGIDRAQKLFSVKAVCGVGMSPAGSDTLATIQKANYVENAPIFYLQGGWASKRVGWFKRRAVNMVTRSIRRQLIDKGSRRTPEEQAYLDMLQKGGSFVAYRNLETIQKWLSQKN